MAPEGGPSHAPLEQHHYPYLAGLPHALPPGLFAARPASLEALDPFPSAPRGRGTQQDEIVGTGSAEFTYPLTDPWSFVELGDQSPIPSSE